MLPPWTALPDIPAGSIGWRMGEGEDCYNRFYRMYSGLTPNERQAYRRDHPEPEGWSGIYETISSHPWL